jgi:hypothetical protein
MAHCTYDEVALVLGIGSGSESNTGSTDIQAKITDVDLLIDARLEWHDLSVSGSSVALVTAASKYWAAAYYQQDFLILRDETGAVSGGQSKVWWNQGSTFLWSYMASQTDNDHKQSATRYRRMRSTTTEEP